MPPELRFALFALVGGLAGGAFAFLLRLFDPAARQGSARHGGPRSSIARWAALVPFFIGCGAVAGMAGPDVERWFSSPVVATLPGGPMLTGRWWIDENGVGHVEIANGILSCGNDYDGSSDAAFVEGTGRCSDGKRYDLRLIRYGRAHWKDRGEGVWRQAERYGWYRFGWKARLAVLTGGWLGLPWHAATAADFASISG